MNIKLAEILISCWFFFGKYRILPILAVFFQADLFHYNPVWLSHVLLAHFSLCHPPTPIINSQASQHANNNNNQQCSSSSNNSNKRGSRFGSVRCCCSKEKEGSTRFWVFFTWPPSGAHITRDPPPSRVTWRDAGQDPNTTKHSTNPQHCGVALLWALHTLRTRQLVERKWKWSLELGGLLAWSNTTFSHPLCPPGCQQLAR